MAASDICNSDDPGLNLALAMVVSSTVPLLLTDSVGTVVATSASFCRTFGLDAASVTGRQIFELGAGEWDVPQLHSLITATLSGDADIDQYEMDLACPGSPVRRLVLNLKKLDYNVPSRVRLLLTISDVTEVRLTEKKNRELVAAHEVLLQEVRHRIANSLQIIASVLMQSARRVHTGEARGHLHDAHNRVMSVAALQQQLAVSTLGTVELKAYLTKLCETIAASMIVDRSRVVIRVIGAETIIDAGTSVSLGLIVTELAINALKHGFPDDRAGVISVDIESDGPRWSLTISDTGVGMPKTKAGAPAGLGTNIVEALARQLDARIEVSDACPGTRVSIIHSIVEARDGAGGAQSTHPAI
jgi:PAS domain S-box-containing protein